MTVAESHRCNRHTAQLQRRFVENWSPWRALRDREHIDFRLAPLPFSLRAIYWPRGDRTAIIISPDLTQVERRAALAHELIHDERGGGCDCPADGHAGLHQLAAKEERSVRSEVARRLVPVAALELLIDRAAALDEGVTANDIAEHFGVPIDVAERAAALRVAPPQPTGTAD